VAGANELADSFDAGHYSGAPASGRGREQLPDQPGKRKQDKEYAQSEYCFQALMVMPDYADTGKIGLTTSHFP
jgi:hypothetical protein